MNTEKREGIERIAEVLLYSDCEMDWEVARGKLRLLYLKKAEALWDAGIRPKEGFYVETAFPFSITFDNREKMNNRIKPKDGESYER